MCHIEPRLPPRVWWPLKYVWPLFFIRIFIGRRNCITRFFCARTAYIQQRHNAWQILSRNFVRSHALRVPKIYARREKCVGFSACCWCCCWLQPFDNVASSFRVVVRVQNDRPITDIYCVEFIAIVAREFYALPWHAVRLRHEFRVLDHFCCLSFTPCTHTRIVIYSRVCACGVCFFCGAACRRIVLVSKALD